MIEKELFHFVNEFDIETYDRLQDFYIHVIQRPSIIGLLIFYIFSILAFLYGLIFLKGDIKSYLMVEAIFTAFVIIVVTYPMLNKILHRRINKFKKNNKKQEIYFYGDHLIIKEANIEGKYKYFNIYKTYETDQDFFFRIDKNIAFIIPKNIIADINKFEEFLEKKFQHRFINKYNNKMKEVL